MTVVYSNTQCYKFFHVQKIASVPSSNKLDLALILKLSLTLTLLGCKIVLVVYFYLCTENSIFPIETAHWFAIGMIRLSIWFKVRKCLKYRNRYCNFGPPHTVPI